MLRAFRPVRRLALALLAAAGLVVAAGAARAEEALVLDNGTVLRGTVMREDATSLTFRLAGVGSDTRITIPRDKVSQRFTTVDPRRWREVAEVAKPVLGETVRAMEPDDPNAVRLARPAIAPLPAEEPESHEETFFERTARRAALALPQSPASRTLLAALGVAVLLCLVGLGAKMADIEGLSLARGTMLALGLGAMLAADLVWPRELLRADHGVVTLPLELLGWVGFAAGLLRCGFGRAFLLLAFVVLSGCLVVFATGVVLVSV
jgi:hypothetical protein